MVLILIYWSVHFINTLGFPDYNLWRYVSFLLLLSCVCFLGMGTIDICNYRGPPPAMAQCST